MAETGSVKVRIDDELIKERMREFLAQAWDEGKDAAKEYADMPWQVDEQLSNPYRD